MEGSDVLGALGIGEQEESLYRALVTLGGTGLDDLARRLRIEEAETEAILFALEQRGLVGQSASRAGQWVAAPPAVALRALLNERRHELEQAEIATARLDEAHRSEPASDLDDVVEVVVGAAAVGQRFHQLQLGAVSEVCALVTDKPTVVTGTDNMAEDIASSRGVGYRVVIERDALIGESTRDEVLASLRRDEEVRVIERVPTKLVIADAAMAMVPLTPNGAHPAALVIRSVGLVESLLALFEFVWRDAWPLRLADDRDTFSESPPGPDELDRQVLALLLTGASDARVAKQLDVGLRTVQRRVRTLMDLSGASTRIQLGWSAHERGWITKD